MQKWWDDTPLIRLLHMANATPMIKFHFMRLSSKTRKRHSPTSLEEASCCHRQFHRTGTCGWPRELKAVPGKQPAIKWGPQSYSCKEMNFATNLRDLGSESFPTWVTDDTEPQPAPGLQPGKSLEQRARPSHISWWKLWDKYVLFRASKFMATCDEAIEN